MSEGLGPLPRLPPTEAEGHARAKVHELRARPASYRQWAVLANSDEDREFRVRLAWYTELLVAKMERRTGDDE